MVANQILCFRLEQRSVIKFLVAEKCKPSEIYSIMYNECGEACFIKKKKEKKKKSKFTNELSHYEPELKRQSMEWK